MTRASGFTLIELMLATVLTSVLMVGVLAVITRVSAPIQPQVSAADQAQQHVIDACVRIISDDLTQARTLDTTGGVGFMGYSSLDPVTHERAQQPVRIRYYVQPIAGRPWLLRQERALVGDPAMKVHTEPVMAGVSRIELVKQQGGGTLEAESDERPLDACWLLRLWTDESERPAITRSIVTQRGLTQ